MKPAENWSLTDSQNAKRKATEICTFVSLTLSKGLNICPMNICPFSAIMSKSDQNWWFKNEQRLLI